MLIGEIRPAIKNQRGDKQSSDNYRPVMNSSVILKLFEYCLLPKIEPYCNLSDRQFGFRKNILCLMPVTVLKEVILNYNKQNSNVHCAFVDLSKAFDNINHKLLIEKMITKNFPPILVKTIYALYDNQYTYVNFNNTKSNTWKIGNGVRQGAILSPLLFNFYINEILVHLTKLNTGCSLFYQKTNVIGYADDVVLIAPCVYSLQILVNIFTSKIKELCLVINAKKSLYIIFKCNRYRNYNYSNTITIDDQELEQVNECKYLGVTLNSSLNLSPDIRRASTQFLSQFYGMFRKFSYSDINILTFLFQAYCTSFYGSELWYNRKGCLSELKAIGVTYHKCLKRLAKIPYYVSNHVTCELLNLPIFIHFINKKMLNYFFNLINSESPCLKDFKTYFKSKSHIYYYTSIILQEVYNVNNFLENDLDALKARILYVQTHEYIQRLYALRK